MPTVGSGVCVRADTATYAFDVAGNMVRADNWAARIRRGYTRSGLLAGDTLTIRTYYADVPNGCEPQPGAETPVTGWTQHVYPLRHEYDLEGRRTRTWHPDSVDACAGQCFHRYGYNAQTGSLDTLIDVLGNTHRFVYDAAGRLTSRVAPGGWTDGSTYDADGRVIARTIGSYTSETMRYDAMGRVDSARMANYANSGPQSARMYYAGLGALAYTSGLTVGSTFEEFWTDALGNRTMQRDVGIKPPPYQDRHRALRYDSYGRHILIEDTLIAPTDTGSFGQWHVTAYDASGNVDHNYGFDLTNGNRLNFVRMSYFSADERLMVANNHVDTTAISAAGGVYEEYRYDALGRRVLVRSRETNFCAFPSTSYCGHLERVVWDGDQVLYEIRARGGAGATSVELERDNESGIATAGNRWGRVGYQHAGGIDMPVSIIRMNMGGQPALLAISPHANWQGDFEIGSWMNGSSLQTCGGEYGCPIIPFPGGRVTADGAETPDGGWFGNLISGKLDGSGLQYMRNRYYDPSTGRFTQQDPIGLAGGLNLYGFASGDPVNFSDPFGLCPGKARSGTICLAFFIQTSTALGGSLRGDGRSFQVFSAPGQSRAYAILDPATGATRSAVNETCAAGLASFLGCAGPMNTNRIRIGSAGDGGFRVQVSIQNAMFPGPAIDADLTFAQDSEGRWSVSGTRNGYPSFEAYYYGKDGSVQVIAQSGEGSPGDLWGKGSPVVDTRKQ